MTTPKNPVRNGVDTASLFATLDTVKESADIAKFQLRATDRWESGTHNRFTIHGFYRAMQDMTHDQVHVVDAGHRTDLVGTLASPRDLSGRNPSSSSHLHDNLRSWLP